MKITVKKDEVRKDTNNREIFQKRIRALLMKRMRNRGRAEQIDGILYSLPAFDPLLDWDYQPICSCEVSGMSAPCYNVKHNRLFGHNGVCLYDEMTSKGGDIDITVCEGYELWLLDNLRLVFTYYCAMLDENGEAQMIYRYPMGKRFPVNMTMNAERFLRDLHAEICSLKQPK